MTFFSLSYFESKKNLLDSIRSRDTSCIFIIYSDHRFYSFEDRECSHQTRYFFTHEGVRYSCNCKGNRGSRFNRNIEEITCISSTYRFEMEFNLVSIYTVLSINERKTLCSVHTTVYHRLPISFRFQRSIFLFFQLVKKKNRSRFSNFEKFHFHIPRYSWIVTVIVIQRCLKRENITNFYI